MASKEFKPKEPSMETLKDELDSINRGLKDFEEGKIHSNETAHKIYERYLSNLEST